ncbi:NADH dehydrogenase [ubiquinone] 1 alpha subcomplex assembly factor 2 [Planococcus citri]|uniref:NADH dehydrogenase [ubiquinone] 1 alpha subcomplex assembly factor 2 n=1 Tax=Planococcus citri TaxID=170843 RepID=UPI0031F89C0E
MSKRNLLATVWNSFVKSFKVQPQRLLGEFKGEDYLGNKYYELPPDPRGGRSRSSRWFESESGDLDQQLPPEWTAWLRRRREDAPTDEEIIRNLATARLKTRNASKNVGSKSEKSSSTRSAYPSSFPDYGDEYEKFPGQHSDDRR